MVGYRLNGLTPFGWLDTVWQVLLYRVRVATALLHHHTPHGLQTSTSLPHQVKKKKKKK